MSGLAVFNLLLLEEGERWFVDEPMWFQGKECSSITEGWQASRETPCRGTEGSKVDGPTWGWNRLCSQSASLLTAIAANIHWVLHVRTDNQAEFIC